MDMLTGQLNTTIEMVENVVKWGQLHLKPGGLRLEYFNLRQLVDRIFGSEILNSTVKNNNLINDIDPGAVIHSDQWMLEFILRNLISNADKFTEYGNIIVSMQKNEEKIILSVTDTGIGIDAQHAAKLFDYKDNDSTLGTKNEKGSGLGLLLVKEFIDQLNGTITVKSKVNKGTSFQITF